MSCVCACLLLASLGPVPLPRGAVGEGPTNAPPPLRLSSSSLAQSSLMELTTCCSGSCRALPVFVVAWKHWERLRENRRVEEGNAARAPGREWLPFRIFTNARALPHSSRRNEICYIARLLLALSPLLAPAQQEGEHPHPPSLSGRPTPPPSRGRAEGKWKGPNLTARAAPVPQQSRCCPPRAWQQLCRAG